jgi:uncharacterized protein YegP (UPF0339 family)
MKPNPYYLSILLFIFFLMASCKDILEPSIKKKQVSLLAPGEQYQSKAYAVQFWWNEVEDASKYRLQIVTPKFDTIGALIADTLVSSNKFIFNLEPGGYQWRVRAENGSSQTPFSNARFFTVIETSIVQQTVQLISPDAGALTNVQKGLFQWGTLFGALSYRLQIDTNNFADESKLLYNQGLPDQQYTFTFPKEQQYQWRLRAENDTVKSKWSAVRIITYDHTPPGRVSLAAPLNEATVSLPAALQWNTVPGAARYKLYALKSDSITSYNPNFPVFVTSNAYNFSMGTSGERIIWKVSALDAAGNEGQASLIQSFVLR